MLKKHHLIAGEWVIGSSTFTSDPAHGPAHDFAVGTPELVDRAAKAAEDAFWSMDIAARQNSPSFWFVVAKDLSRHVAT